MPIRRLACLMLLASLVIVLLPRATPAAGGRVKITVVDQATGKPVASRMHLADANGRPRKAPRLPFWHDHFVFDGEIELRLPRGHYTFVLEHGPEYLSRQGYFTIDAFADDEEKVDLRQIVDMAANDWYSGDLFVRRPPVEMELLMRADDLHVAEVVTWTEKSQGGRPARVPLQPLVEFDDGRCFHQLAGADVAGGTGLVLLNLSRPLELPDQGRPEAWLELLRGVRKEGGWIHANRIDAWDMPVWAAAGLIDSVALADSRLERGGVSSKKEPLHPRDRLLYPDPHGTARWTHDVYFHLLNCGLRIPPAAGSGSGLAHNPVGYNRVYAKVDGEFSYDAWFEALRNGKVVVTNGPLMRPEVHGHPPGHVFRAGAGEAVELEIGLHLVTKERIAYLEIIKDGRVDQEVRLDEFAKNGRLPPVKFERSGWFLVRVVTEATDTYRFAMTGPYYVEIGDEPRISRRSAEFFLKWIEEQPSAADRQQVRGGKPDDDVHARALGFWKEKVAQANAD